MSPPYRGRIAPSPTGFLHLGHARTFWIAMERAEASNGSLIFRDEDLDFNRCNIEYSQAALEDLKWFGCHWTEGPDKEGLYGPYKQSQRLPLYFKAWKQLKDKRLIYPCTKSRKEIQAASMQKGGEDKEPIYPEAWRPDIKFGDAITEPDGYNWRFRVSGKKNISFIDQRLGPCQFLSEVDFGDFLIWRKDGIPSYELSVVVDDQAMKITEVVRGEDLLISTARQLLIYEALGYLPPDFYHAPLVVNTQGERLAKTVHSMSLREFKQSGRSPEDLRKSEEWWSGIEDVL